MAIDLEQPGSISDLQELVIDNIKHWDVEKQKLVPIHLTLSGNSIKIFIKATRETQTIQFFGERKMKCSIELDMQSSTHTVMLMDDTTLMFLMSEKQFQLISEYFDNINLANLVLYSKKVNEVLAELFEHIDELIDITIRFIEDQPPGFFTSFINIMLLEHHIYNVHPEKYEQLLLSSQFLRERFVYNNQSLIKSNQGVIESFFSHDFKFFQRLLSEKSEDIDLLVAYLFLMNIVLQRNAFKWRDEHSKNFEDIETENIDILINRFLALENNNFTDVDAQGTFFFYLHHLGKFDIQNKMLDNMERYHIMLAEQIETVKFKNFKNRLHLKPGEKRYSINDVDMMNGQEFEFFLALLFSKMAYQTEITKASGDQGIDVIAEKNGQRIGIQAKCYSSTVGNSAIQEAVAGKAFYKLDKVIVVTNNFFSDSAIQLAQSNGVILWDRSLLKEKITEVLN